MSKILPRSFFNRDTRVVARELLGLRLVTTLGGTRKMYTITEVEAYDGPEDKACHAHKGRTQRTDVMFGSAGYFYVYLVYGMHNMLNIVTGPKEYPAAVLIRGVEGISGPGRLTKNLGITRTLNKRPIAQATGLWIEEGGVVSKSEIIATPRIGVDYAGEWAKKPYRFVWKKKRTGLTSPP